MNEKSIETVKEHLREILLYTTAGISKELPADTADLEIRFENRQITIKMQTKNTEIKESMLASRAFDKVEERAQQLQKQNAEPEPEPESNDVSKPDVRDKVLEG